MQRSLSPGDTIVHNGETFTVQSYCTIEVNDPVVHPENGTLLETFCNGCDKYGRYADGNGGTYESLIESNSSECGYCPPPPPPEPGNIENVSIGLSDVGNEARYKARFTHPTSGAAQNFHFMRSNDQTPLSPVSGPSRPNGDDTVEVEFAVGDFEPGNVFAVRTCGGTTPDGQSFSEGPWVETTV